MFILTVMFFLSGLLRYTTAAACSTENCHKGVQTGMTEEQTGTHRCRRMRKNKWQHKGW